MHVAFKTELFVLFFKDLFLFFNYVYACDCWGLCTCECSCSEDRLGGPGTGVSGSPELPNMGAGILTNFLSKSRSLS